MHLEKYALQIFHMMSVEERKDYDTVVKKLERFRSVDIEELKGIEFLQRMQKGESVEQLGIDLLDLGRKAFPNIVGTEFDRILEGRFFFRLCILSGNENLAPLSLVKLFMSFMTDLEHVRGMNSSSQRQLLPKVNPRNPLLNHQAIKHQVTRSKVEISPPLVRGIKFPA